VYGNGSQTRGLINIVDTVECIRLAAENPARRGEFRVFNQLTETMSVRQIAETVAGAYPGGATIEHVENPRVEAEDHYYNVKHSALEELGLKPTLLGATLIDHVFAVVEAHKDRVDVEAIMPTVRWRDTTSELRQPVGAVAAT
jgi:UDP-sulfoquinovose synthase